MRLLYKYEIYILAKRIPDNFLPIGDDFGGNIICISIRGNNFGKIYFWDHEEDTYEGEYPSYENVHLVADSFDGFVNLLQDE